MCHEASESAGDQSGKFLLTPYSDAAPSGIDDQVRCPSASILFSSLGWYRFQIVVPFAPASRPASATKWMGAVAYQWETSIAPHSPSFYS